MQLHPHIKLKRNWPIFGEDRSPEIATDIEALTRFKCRPPCWIWPEVDYKNNRFPGTHITQAYHISAQSGNAAELLIIELIFPPILSRAGRGNLSSLYKQVSQSWLISTLWAHFNMKTVELCLATNTIIELMLCFAAVKWTEIIRWQHLRQAVNLRRHATHTTTSVVRLLRLHPAEWHYHTGYFIYSRTWRTLTDTLVVM